MPVFEGYAIPFAIESGPIAGKELTNQVHSRLIKDSVFIESLQRDEMTRDISQSVKESFCSVALDYD